MVTERKPPPDAIPDGTPHDEDPDPDPNYPNDPLNPGDPLTGGIDPDDLPPDELAPSFVPSWLRGKSSKKLNRAQKGNYEGILRDIEAAPDTVPKSGALYNMREFAKITDTSTEEDIREWCRVYWEHQKELWLANQPGADPNVSIEEFIEIYENDMARSPSHWSPYDRVGVVNADP